MKIVKSVELWREWFTMRIFWKRFFRGLVGHTQECLGVTLGLLLRNHCWWGQGTIGDAQAQT